jgi:hypothetical protein
MRAGFGGSGASELPKVRTRGRGAEGTPPCFLVSVASKGFSKAVSLLFATLAGRFISVASKGVKARAADDPDRVAGELMGERRTPSPPMFL